jgi:DegV family protein with EDD domain
MSVKIVTDSTADIPPHIASELGIHVIPIYVRFGEKVYRDGIDINNKEFYQQLTTSAVHPTTSQPTPEDFAKLYRELSPKADGIVSIHISSKISGTYNSALLGKNLVSAICPIDIIDSTYNSMGLGLLAMTAARIAGAGTPLTEVLAETKKAIPRISMLGFFDNLKYAIAGGRINKTTGKVVSILKVKPVFAFHDGEVSMAGIARTHSKGIDKLCDFVKNKTRIEELSIVHSAVPQEASKLKERLAEFFPREKIIIAQLGAALGVHGGPGMILVALRES